MKTHINSFAGIMLATGSMMAAPITWTDLPRSVGDESVIDRVGTLVHAGTWGSGEEIVTIGSEDIIFEDAIRVAEVNPMPGTENAITNSNGENSSVQYFDAPGAIDFGFETVMSSFAFDGPNPKEVVLNNLTIGNTYRVQLFVSDDRNFGSNRRQLWSDSAIRGDADANETPDFAHSDSTSVIGTFVADGVTQTIYGHGTTGGNTVVNAYILREVNTGDMDNDGLPDFWEELFTDPSSTTALNPTDDLENGGVGDGVNNLREFQNGGNPLLEDTDMDGLLDLAELDTHNTRIDIADTDDDGSSDGEEVNIEMTNPLVQDTDDDGVFDGPDAAPNDPTNDDDGDDLTNIDETQVHGSDPLLADTDGDGLRDGDEVNGDAVNGFTSDPTSVDTDNDEIPDNIEVERGANPDEFNDVSILTPVIWQTPQNVTGMLSDIRMNGNLVAAYNSGGAELTVGSMVFTEGGPNLDFVAGGFDPFTRAQDDDYEALISTATWSPASRFFALEGLTPGTMYQLQIWVVDTRDCCRSRFRTFTTDPLDLLEEQTVELNSGEEGNETDFPGQYVIGTFTAAEAKEYIFSSGTNGTQINALILRDLSSPSPAGIEIVDFGFNGPAFEVTYTGLDPSTEYVFNRTTDLTDATEIQIGTPVTPTSSMMMFSDPNPPTGAAARAFYRLEVNQP